MTELRDLKRGLYGEGTESKENSHHEGRKHSCHWLRPLLCQAQGLFSAAMPPNSPHQSGWGTPTALFYTEKQWRLRDLQEVIHDPERHGVGTEIQEYLPQGPLSTLVCPVMPF